MKEFVDQLMLLLNHNLWYLHTACSRGLSYVNFVFFTTNRKSTRKMHPVTIARAPSATPVESK